MVSLATINQKFLIYLTVIEGGSGMLQGELSETTEKSGPSYTSNKPRHVLRTPSNTALKSGMVIRSPAGVVFLVGENGPSEQREGVIWKSFRLFEASGQYHWTRRGKTIDPITKLVKDTNSPIDLGLIWATIESDNSAPYDGTIHAAQMEFRVIAAAPLENGDQLDNRSVSKLDKQIGLSIGTLS